jgi:MFS family permease
MRRGIAVTWHLVSFLIASVLYFFFVLPRWPELMGDTSHTLGTVARVATGVFFGFSALPVVFTLLKVQRPEFGTPRLALSLQLWSIIGHVTAGLLIIGAAIAEIWLDLDTSGRWLFAVYGAAAGIALLSAAAFYLSFAAELPAPPPKPLKPKKVKAGKLADEGNAVPAVAVEDTADTESAADTDDAPAATTTEISSTQALEPESQALEAGATASADTPTAAVSEASDDPTVAGAAEDAAGKPARTALRNRRRGKLSDDVSVTKN